MTDHRPTVLCLASYHKGDEFLRECKRLGCGVLLLTVTALEHADWPQECIDESFYMPDLSKVDDVIGAVSFLARTRAIERLVPLDDYDVLTAAAVREHIRTPGMGVTTAHRFRDKLAMRERAWEMGILVPEFVQVLNHERLRRFAEDVPPPWVLKPRAEASSIGITKIESHDELWQRVEALGDRQSQYLLERYIPGEVFHVDSIVAEREVVFAEAHRYARPPFEVFHLGGISISRTLGRDTEDQAALHALNREVIEALGLVRGVTHAEFIKSTDGRFYFLEIAARVGGANTVELIEAATGINLWQQWARIEIDAGRTPYSLPPLRSEYAAVIVSLARQEYPDTSAYDDPEIVLRINKRHHVGFVLASPSPERLDDLLSTYGRRIEEDFHAVLPAREGRPPTEP